MRRAAPTLVATTAAFAMLSGGAMASPALTTSTAARANAISAPSAVRSPSVTFPATNQARLAWIAPANPVGHPVSGYQYCLAACGVTASWHGTGLTGSIPNAFYRRTALTPGRTYQVLIRAINSAGGGQCRHGLPPTVGTYSVGRHRLDGKYRRMSPRNNQSR